MGKRGDFEPRDVLHSSAPLTNKMVMLVHVRFEPYRVPFHDYLANQSGQALVYRGPRSARIGPVVGLINFFRSGMPRISIQVVQNRIALRSAADFAVTKGGE